MMKVMKPTVSTHRGLGITAGLDAGLVRELAAHCEQLGYHSLWSNDEPTARGLDTIAELAKTTAKIELGVGVLPLHRYQPAQIAADVDRLGLDPARLWLGIGTGSLSPQIDTLHRAVAELRTLLPQATRIVVAAMRPRLCRLGGAVADGVLLNWMPAGHAAQALPQSIPVAAFADRHGVESSQSAGALVEDVAVGGDHASSLLAVARSSHAIR